MVRSNHFFSPPNKTFVGFIVTRTLVLTVLIRYFAAGLCMVLYTEAHRNKETYFRWSMQLRQSSWVPQQLEYALLKGLFLQWRSASLHHSWNQQQLKRLWKSTNILASQFLCPVGYLTIILVLRLCNIRW